MKSLKETPTESQPRRLQRDYHRRCCHAQRTRAWARQSHRIHYYQVSPFKRRRSRLKKQRNKHSHAVRGTEFYSLVQETIYRCGLPSSTTSSRSARRKLNALDWDVPTFKGASDQNIETHTTSSMLPRLHNSPPLRYSEQIQ